MGKSLRLSIFFLAAALFGFSAAMAQSTVTGTVVNSINGEPVTSVTVTVKGGTTGTFTNSQGAFTITVPSLPATLVFTSVGFDPQEVLVESASTPIRVSFVPSIGLGQEVVVSATRTATRILDAPVTVERMSSSIIRNLPAPSYYEGIVNLKGVDMHTASLTFRTVTTRGFMSSGNTRLNQLIDGMDNQAPGLNFAVGSVIGLTELDVDNIELLSGASSALYGSGGMNGTLLINSKNPFRFPGLSFQIKQGIMHLNSPSGKSPSPYYDWSGRWAHKFSDKFAVKIAAQFLKAEDWEATDYSNVARNNVLSKQIPGSRETDPNYDGINVYGDETSANIRQLVGAAYLANPAAPTLFGVPTAFALANTPSQNVSRTGYQERDLVDYNTMNFKGTAGIHYMITPGIEASWNSYFGTGTTVYTGADRYSLRNLKMAQHKFEVRHRNWFLRGYTTQENSGDSYQATVLGRLINESWKRTVTFAPDGVTPTPLPTDWLVQYIGSYLAYKYNGSLGTGTVPGEYGAHQFARRTADNGRLIPGTAAFNNAAQTIKGNAIPKGAKFNDRSDLYSAEAQLNLSDQVGFSNTVEVIVGGQYKGYALNSQGTIFADTAGTLTPAEYGGYVQFRKRFLDDVLTITASGRYDDHTNFDGRFTPRFTAVIRVAPENNIRASYQTAYRFPTNQDQYINLNTGGSTFLIGLLPEFQDYYKVAQNPTYTAESINAYRNSGNPANVNLLQQASFSEVKPESVTTYELGYKGVIQRRLYIDAYGYYSTYENFLGRVAVGQSGRMSYGNGPATGTPTQTDLFSSITSRNLSYAQNSPTEVKVIGWGVTAEYQLPRGFAVYGNVFSDKLRDLDSNFVSYFNAPDIRYNIGLRNTNIYRGVGFNVVYRFQGENYYEGTFATGTLPSFGWLDAQISYSLPDTKSMIRIGGTNILNNYQRTGFGSPYVGGLYYVSFAYNVL